ncbi:hypothetical protein IMSAGC003_03152 [Lachnospiraceae bacterium]|nr:hypothetical protein [Lachnospiraceae bacterium]GFH96593.1 hypothetical protein IMSAGC003_03152 [Lachnospiraceae bacterium]
MPQQEGMPDTARKKRNCWNRGNGSYSFCGELWKGSKRKKRKKVGD